MKHLVLIILFVPAVGFSAIPRKKSSSDFVRALSAPHKIAVAEIYKMGPTAYKKLNDMAFDSSQPMATRWKSFMVMTSIGNKKSLPEIDKALRDKVWYMRSAGLLAMQKIDRNKSIEWAQFLLKKDPALLVRVKALDVLKDIPEDQNKDLFWSQLYDKGNYHRDESLWIRGKLASHLADFPRKKDLKKWKKALFDKDVKVQNEAVRAIEKITGKKESGEFSKKVSLWKQKVSKKKNL